MGISLEMPRMLNVLLLDADGKRVSTKYYDPKMTSLEKQLAYEKMVFSKTRANNARGDAEMALFGEHLVCYKFAADLHFYVTACDEENELIIAMVLNAFFDAVSLLLRGVVEKRTALENLDLVMLTIDELVFTTMTPDNIKFLRKYTELMKMTPKRIKLWPKCVELMKMTPDNVKR